MGTKLKHSDSVLSNFQEMPTVIGNGILLKVRDFPFETLHDFLSYLTEQMISMNQQKQMEMQRFLLWLEKKIQFPSNKIGELGLESLNNKTIIMEYIGDHRKSENHISFERLWDVLKENSRRSVRSLDAAFERELRREYEKSLAVLLPIKKKLATTDWLIDQIVYRLYGLTEEEIAIVEGK